MCLPSAFDLPDSVDSSAPSTRLTPVSVTAEMVVQLEAKLKSEDPEEAAEEEKAIGVRRRDLTQAKEDIGVLETITKDTVEPRGRCGELRWRECLLFRRVFVERDGGENGISLYLMILSCS